MAAGAPSKYRKEYCDALIKHMEDGGDFESFGAIPRVSKKTLYNWVNTHEEFLHAKEVGLELSRRFWINVAKMQATGQLRRVKSERARFVLDENGREVPALDKNGNAIYDREYEATTGAQAVLIFMLKNIHGFRDNKQIEMTGKDGGPMEFSNISNEELKGRIDALIQKRNAGKK
jgi:hypothetical protein